MAAGSISPHSARAFPRRACWKRSAPPNAACGFALARKADPGWIICMNIAVFLPNWIGDVVMATPALRALRRHFLDAHLLGICRSYVDGVLRGSPWFDDHLYLDTDGPWSRRWPAVAWRLRRERIDLAILFPNSFRSALVARLGRCARRVGYRPYL